MYLYLYEYTITVLLGDIGANLQAYRLINHDTLSDEWYKIITTAIKN